MLNKIMRKVESKKEERRLNKEQNYYEYLFNSDDYKRYEERTATNKAKEVKVNDSKKAAMNREEKEKQERLAYCKRIHEQFKQQENKNETIEEKLEEKEINVHTNRDEYLKMIYNEYFANKEKPVEEHVDVKEQVKDNKTNNKDRKVNKVNKNKTKVKPVVEQQPEQEEYDEIEKLVRYAYDFEDGTYDEYDENDYYEDSYYVDGYNNSFYDDVQDNDNDNEGYRYL